jgi:hypothetical protein
MRGDCQASIKTLARSSEYCITGLDGVMTGQPEISTRQISIARSANNKV